LGKGRRSVNLKIENIKKLMGWCPNAKASESRRNVSFENFDFDIPDRARGESGDLKSLGWLRKASMRALLVDIFLLLMYFPVFYLMNVNLIFLLAGVFVSLLLVIFTWNSQMKTYDALVKQPVIDNSKMKKITIVLPFVLYFGIFSIYFLGHEPDLQALFSFAGGFLAYFWFSYLRILCWEKKNHKTIYFDKSHGTWKKSYVILEGK
jgi:hypothetical protein